MNQANPERVPFFELKRLYLEQKEEIDRAVAGVLASGWYILGKSLAAFESDFAAAHALPASAGVGCNSGTDAIVLALLAAGVRADDEVIVPSHTAIPTITALRSIGAVPRFAEIDPETWLLDTRDDGRRLGELITPRTRAVIAVHLYGNMVDVDAIAHRLDQAGQSGRIAIVEDVAQAQGARLANRLAGTIARFGAFSFYPSKNIGALGDGGAILAANEQDARMLRILRNYGQVDRYNAEHGHGLNSRLDEIQAAILSARLPLLETWNARKDAMTARYRQELSGLPLAFQKTTPNCKPAWHLCVAALEDQATRDRLMDHLKNDGIETIIHYPIPTHTQAAFRTSPPASLPITESLASRIVSLPMNAALRPDEQERVIKSARKFFGH